jgi:hypothetical protein
MSVVDQYEAPTRTVSLIRASDQAAIAEVQTQIIIAKLGSDRGSLADETPQLEAELEAMRSDATEAALVFTFQALSPKALEELILAHPSADEKERFNAVTFPPALLAASCIKAGDDDGLAVEEAARLWDTFAEGDASELFGAAWGVSTAANLLPFSVTDTANPAPASAPNSTIAPLEVLHTATS